MEYHQQPPYGYPEQSERRQRTREERRSLSESFSEGTSKFFSSVIAKKNGLFSDISNISSQIQSTFSGSLSDDADERQPQGGREAGGVSSGVGGGGGGRRKDWGQRSPGHPPASGQYSSPNHYPASSSPSQQREASRAGRVQAMPKSSSRSPTTQQHQPADSGRYKPLETRHQSMDNQSQQSHYHHHHHHQQQQQQQQKQQQHLYPKGDTSHHHPIPAELRRSSRDDSTPPGTPPPRPPPPKKPPSVQELREKERIIQRMSSMPAYSRSDSSGSIGSTGSAGRDRPLSMKRMNISFDEPLYSGRRGSEGSPGVAATGRGEEGVYGGEGYEDGVSLGQIAGQFFPDGQFRSDIDESTAKMMEALKLADHDRERATPQKREQPMAQKVEGQYGHSREPQRQKKYRNQYQHLEQDPAAEFQRQPQTLRARREAEEEEELQRDVADRIRSSQRQQFELDPVPHRKGDASLANPRRGIAEAERSEQQPCSYSESAAPILPPVPKPRSGLPRLGGGFDRFGYGEGYGDEVEGVFVTPEAGGTLAGVSSSPGYGAAYVDRNGTGPATTGSPMSDTGSTRSGDTATTVKSRTELQAASDLSTTSTPPGDWQPEGQHARAPKFTTTKRRSSTVDEMLFDDYVEPEGGTIEPFSADGLPPDQDLMSFEQLEAAAQAAAAAAAAAAMTAFSQLQDSDRPPATGWARLPRSEPEDDDRRRRHQPQGEGEDDDQGGTAKSKINSSSSNGLGLYTSTSAESSDAEYGGEAVHRSASVGSDKSWSSNYSLDSQPDDLTLESMEFMKTFVEKIFTLQDSTSQVDKAKFGELCQYPPGRLWFARYVNSQRVHNKRVPEETFFRLVQHLSVCLFECHEAEDFSPAKTLMNMCFTFYCDMPSPTGEDRSFLYMFLREQPIWQSLRFWNAAFFDAVQCERCRRPMPTNDAANDTMTDDRNFQENITFGQLGTFACNMRAFGLSRELCTEFLRKQSTIANLSDEQVKLLRDQMERITDQ